MIHSSRGRYDHYYLSVIVLSSPTHSKTLIKIEIKLQAIIKQLFMYNIAVFIIVINN